MKRTKWNARLALGLLLMFVVLFSLGIHVGRVNLTQNPLCPRGAGLLSGDYLLDSKANATFTGDGGDRAGRSMACVGDLNGDGYEDFLIGSAYNTFGGAAAGRVWLFYGNGLANQLQGDYDLTYAANATFTGGLDYNAGSSVAGAGDVNGDGYPDFLVGALKHNSFTGAVFLIYGREPANPFQGDYNLADINIPNATFTGEAAGDQTGRSVAGVGDVNGDGYADFLIGAIYNAAGGSQAGRAYLFYGRGPSNQLDGSYVVTTGNATLTGYSGDQVGGTVAGAGDVNGDGYADFLVGAAYWNDTISDRKGRAYLLYGSATPISGNHYLDDFADATFTGEASYDYAGLSVAGAGDVNGDGYADFLVGAAFWNDTIAEDNKGRAYLFYGNVSAKQLQGNYDLANTANATFTGEAASDKAGDSVAGAGDVNGDGFDDLLIGAPGWNDTITDDSKGRTYLFYGNGSESLLLGNYPLGTAGVANATFTGEAKDDESGRPLGCAGDVNGDGSDDLLISAWGWNDTIAEDNKGRVYLFYGFSLNPARIWDLAAGNPTHSTVDLLWTAPGDDGWNGTAMVYYLKVSASPINDSNWASATTIQAPVPAAGGSIQSFTVTGLTPSTTYYFAMVAVDGDGHAGFVSNSPKATTLVEPQGIDWPFILGVVLTPAIVAVAIIIMIKRRKGRASGK